jgi:glyoxylase-like metal-dependent hydrolase (beta-lactamase superfamily II)
LALPVVTDWFASQQLTDGITLFTEPHIDPWLQPNTWHVRGRERDLLIDTGMGVGDLRSAMGRLVDRPILAVATHTHFDHVGSHHQFPERACHKAEADILTNPTSANTVADLMADGSIRALPYPDYRIAEYHIAAAPPSRILNEGDVIDLGDRVFEVLHLPGHSPGSIGLWERATGIFFSGDAVYDGELLDKLYHSDIDRYVETMRRLRELPVRVVHCGHYGSFDRDRMVELIDAYIVSKSAPICPFEAAVPRA